MTGPDHYRRAEHDHRPSGQAAAWRLVREGGSWCCSLAPAGRPRNLAGPITQDRHRADSDAAIRPPGRWSQQPRGDHRHGAAADQATSSTFPAGTMDAANRPTR
jgi:hypothetical protein